MDYPELALFIDGLRQAAGRKTLDVLEPATETVLGKLPMATPDDIEKAIQAAHRTFPAWRRTPALERATILRKAATVLRARTAEIAPIITRELGKPLAESKNEIATAAEMFEWAAEEARRLYGRIIPGRIPGIQQVVTLEPIGPVAAFSGWNAPAITPSRKIAGALAAGCSVVIKPSEETPAIALEIARALHESGLPAGVLNMVFGDPEAISTQLLKAPSIRAVTFTGSTAIGRSLAELAASSLKRITLELGGHAPVLVFADADVDAAVTAISAAKFRNSGQICTSPTRMYVHESVYKDFVAKIKQRANALRVGNGLETGVQMGPMANPRRLDAMSSLTADAQAQGARVMTGGKRIHDKGWYWLPTVIADFNDDCRAANVEPFGPMALVRPFSTFDEVLAQANRLPFGLASYVFSQHAKTIHALTEAIESGVVCVNHCQASLPETPFGGVKDSGFGREGGLEGLHEFMQLKYVSQV
jgi:succinate-semialdehyde dehydrogenase/glutarate-semialdehyde dehydrogenase